MGLEGTGHHTFQKFFHKLSENLSTLELLPFEIDGKEIQRFLFPIVFCFPYDYWGIDYLSLVHSFDGSFPRKASIIRELVNSHAQATGEKDTTSCNLIDAWP